MSSSFSFKTSSFSSLIICISLNVTCERDDFMYRISNPQLLHYNGSKYLSIGIFIDDSFTYNLLCPVSISDEQTDKTSLSLNCTWNSYHQCLNTLKTYIGIDLPLERSKAGSAMLVSYSRQFSYTIQCEKAFSLPYPFYSYCSQISKPTDLPYHPLECQAIHQYPWTLKTSVNI